MRVCLVLITMHAILGSSHEGSEENEREMAELPNLHVNFFDTKVRKNYTVYPLTSFALKGGT